MKKNLSYDPSVITTFSYSPDRSESVTMTSEGKNFMTQIKVSAEALMEACKILQIKESDSKKDMIIWAPENFPAKMEYTPSGEDRPTYQVEVLGYLQIAGGLKIASFRTHTFGALRVDVSGVEFLPTNEFEEHFKKYKFLDKE